MKLNDILELTDDGSTHCAECNEHLGNAATAPFDRAILREQPSTAAGPGIRVDPKHFTDRQIVLRQAFCPGCLALLSTEIVPSDEPSYRRWHLVA
jgi:N-methylhydantoinase B